jgi:kynurenine formamidase
MTMKTRSASLVSFVSLAAICAWPAAAPAQPSADGALPTLTAADIEEMFERVSNWGRWGDDDQRGTLNLITPEKRRQAAALVREGISVSLSQDLSSVEAVDNTMPLELVMTAQPGAPVAMDELRIFYHGLTYAHMDALCHARYNGKAYNGFDASDASETGCATAGVEHLKDGVLSRGILIDVPRLKGVPYLEPGTPVLASDIEAWEREAGVTIEPGDVVLVRTGRWAKRADIGPYSLQGGSPGVHVSALPLLRERDVAVLGTDVGLDVIPAGVDGVVIPTHTVAIAGMGLLIIDNADLEALAETAERLGRWEFMFSAAPIPVAGATGSVVNAIATF